MELGVSFVYFLSTKIEFVNNIGLLGKQQIMDPLLILALIQGITEFLPISSSGHLVLAAKFLNYESATLVLDVAMHVGTLGAVILYVWRDIVFMLVGVGNFFRGRTSAGGKLFLYLVFGTIPIAGAGYWINSIFPNGLRDLQIIAWATLFFGVILFLADYLGMTLRRVEHLRLGDIFVIGIAQVLALIPGTSRSGICMTIARILGMERREAAHLSLLLGIPAIFGAGCLKSFDLWVLGEVELTIDAVYAASISFCIAFVSIALMMAWLQRASLKPFAIYRISVLRGPVGL